MSEEMKEQNASRGGDQSAAEADKSLRIDLQCSREDDIARSQG